jgi:hypothetical protein
VDLLPCILQEGIVKMIKDLDINAVIHIHIHEQEHTLPTMFLVQRSLSAIVNQCACEYWKNEGPQKDTPDSFL